MATKTKLDRLDIRILAELQKNGRISNVDLKIGSRLVSAIQSRL